MKLPRKSIILKILLFVATSFLLLVYILTVDPTRGGLVTLLVPIILSWILLYMVISGMLQLLFKKIQQTTVRFIAASVSSAGLFFLLLSGIGTISLVDVVLTVALVVVVGIYVSRLWK